MAAQETCSLWDKELERVLVGSIYEGRFYSDVHSLFCKCFQWTVFFSSDHTEHSVAPFQQDIHLLQCSRKLLCVITELKESLIKLVPGSMVLLHYSHADKQNHFSLNATNQTLKSNLVWWPIFPFCIWSESKIKRMKNQITSHFFNFIFYF